MTPTTLSCERADLLQTLEVYENLSHKESPGAAFIGMHLEGPYFSMNQRGAQDPRYIRDPDPVEYTELITPFPLYPPVERCSGVGRSVAFCGLAPVEGGPGCACAYRCYIRRSRDSF